MSCRVYISRPPPASNVRACAPSIKSKPSRHATAIEEEDPAAYDATAAKAVAAAAAAVAACPRASLVSAAAGAKNAETICGVDLCAFCANPSPAAEPPRVSSGGSARCLGAPTAEDAHRSTPPARRARKSTNAAGSVKKTSYSRDRIPLESPKKDRSRPTSRPCMALSLNVA